MEQCFLYEILTDPVTREPLVPDGEGCTLKTVTGERCYPVTDGVPKIITEDKSSANQGRDKGQETAFNYLHHYQTDAEVSDYSEKGFPAATKHEIRRLHESVLRETVGSNAIILDAGCGNGWAAAALVPKGHRVVSMDISVKNPAESVKRTSLPNHYAVVADVFQLPFKDEAFDFIIASEIMEHVTDPGLFISCLLKVLKKGGKLIITTPYNEKTEYYLCVHCNRLTPKNAHLHSFSEKNITEFLPVSDISYTLTKFSNKYLAKLKLHLILQYFPYKIWRLADKTFNFLTGNETRFKIVITKN